jgi:hypothetical protein
MNRDELIESIVSKVRERALAEIPEDATPAEIEADSQRIFEEITRQTGVKIPKPSRHTAKKLEPTLIFRIGRDAGSDLIWFSQVYGDKPPVTSMDISRAELDVIALRLEVDGFEAGADFVRQVIERMDRTPVSEAVEGEYRFPTTTVGTR